MTDKEKLKKIKELADAMCVKMQNLTTDTSGIRKAMGEYRQFIINEYDKEEPVSEDLGEAANNALNNVLNTHEIVNVRSCIEMFKYGAEWKEKEMQSTIELAEDHAMLAGMEKMKEEMMKEPKLYGYVARDEDGNLHIFEVEPRRLEEKHRWWDRDYSCHIIDNDAFPDLRWKDEPICVKLIIIKED